MNIFRGRTTKASQELEQEFDHIIIDKFQYLPL